jgi:hypothetical protein
MYDGCNKMRKKYKGEKFHMPQQGYRDRDKNMKKNQGFNKKKEDMWKRVIKRKQKFVVVWR